MRKTFSQFLGLTTVLALSVAACGDDVTGVTSGDEMTSTEVTAVMAAFSAAFDSIGADVGALAVSQQASAMAGAGAVPALAPIDLSQNFDLSVPCELGTLNVSGSMDGSIDDETFDTDLTMDVSWDPSGCVVSDDTSTFTVNGAPEIRLVLDMTSTQDPLCQRG